MGNAQDKKQFVQCPPEAICDPTKFDEYTIISWGDERARLDNVAIQLQHEPNMITYLDVYAGRRACVGEVEARAVRARNYLVKKRGIKADRVLWKDGGNREKQTVEIWIQPRGLTEPYPSPTVEKSAVQIIKNCKPENRNRRKRK